MWELYKIQPKYEMLRGLGIILWVKDRIIKSRELDREESEDIRVCEITLELYSI